MDGKVGQVLDVAMPIGAAVASTYGENYARGAAIGANMWQENRERYDVKKQGKRLAELIPELAEKDVAAQTEVYKNVVNPMLQSGNWEKDPVTGKLVEIKQEVVPAPNLLMDVSGMGFPMVNKVPTGQTFDAEQYAPKPSMNWEMARAAAEAGDVLTARNLILEGQQEINNTRLKAMDIAYQTLETNRGQQFQLELQAAADAAAKAREQARIEAEALQRKLDRDEQRQQFADNLDLQKKELEAQVKHYDQIYNLNVHSNTRQDIRENADLYRAQGQDYARTGTELMQNAAAARAELLDQFNKALITADQFEAENKNIDKMYEEAATYINNSKTAYAAMGAVLNAGLIENGKDDEGIGLDDIDGEGGKGGGKGKGSEGGEAPPPTTDPLAAPTGRTIGTGTATEFTPEDQARAARRSQFNRFKVRLGDVDTWTEEEKKFVASEVSKMRAQNMSDREINVRLRDLGVDKSHSADIVGRLRLKDGVGDWEDWQQQVHPERYEERRRSQIVFRR